MKQTLKTIGLVLLAVPAVLVLVALSPILWLVGAWCWRCDPEGARREMA